MIHITQQLSLIHILSNTLELTGAAWELNFKNLKLASANSKGPVDLSKTSGPNTVTFDNVTSVGSSLYGGGGNTNVVIKGNTTSTVSDSYQSGNGQTQFVQRNVGQAGRSDKRRESNIHDAKAVIVSEGASLTPVSYTHLDVYKRQNHGYGNSRSRCSWLHF